MIEPKRNSEQGRGTAEKTEKMQIVETKGMSDKELTLLLRAFDYDTDGEFVLKDGKRHLDKYTNEEIKLRQMALLPYRGGVLVIDGNPLSISSYLEEVEEDDKSGH